MISEHIPMSFKKQINKADKHLLIQSIDTYYKCIHSRTVYADVQGLDVLGTRLGSIGEPIVESVWRDYAECATVW